MDKVRCDYLIEAISEYERMDYDASAVTLKMFNAHALHDIAFSLEKIADSLEKGNN